MKYSYVSLLTDDPLDCIVMYCYSDDSAWYELARCSRNQVNSIVSALNAKSRAHFPLAVSEGSVNPNQFGKDV